jgi:hypothetical protein
MGNISNTRSDGRVTTRNMMSGSSETTWKRIWDRKDWLNTKGISSKSTLQPKDILTLSRRGPKGNVVSVKRSSLLWDVANFWEGTVTKPPTPLFFPIFSGHFDTHFVFLCFQPQSRQPQRSGSPASTVRLTTTCHQDRLAHHLPPCQSPYETSLHTAV